MRHHVSRGSFGVAAFVAAVASVSPAAAQSNKVAAEALFEEGRRLVAEGNAEAACPKLADSQRLDPTPGTLLNLANCYEKLGRTATAWATYKEAASLASASGRSDLVATALRHAETLVPRLSRLTIVVPSVPDGLQVARDGVLTAPAERGMAIPVDPGKHTIEARAPQKKTWTGIVEIGDGAVSERITIPQLEDAPAEPASRATSPPGEGGTTGAGGVTESPPPSRGFGTQRAVALGVLGVAVVGAGLGTAFAVTARSKYNDSLASCPNDKNLCTADGVAKRDDARTAGNVATVAFGVGAVALVTAAGLWFFAPSDRAKTTGLRVRLAPALGGATVGGQW